MRYVLLLFTVFSLIGCNNKNKESENSDQINDTTTTSSSEAKLFLKQIQDTYRTDDFESHQAITFEVSSEADQSINKLSLQTDLSKIKMEMSNDDFIIFNNGKLYTSPEFPEENLAEFKNIIQLFGLAFNTETWVSKAQEKDKDSLQDEIYTTVKLKLKHADYLPTSSDLKVYTSPGTGFITVVDFKNKSPEHNYRVFYKNYFSIGRIPFAKHWEIYEGNLPHTKHIDKLSINRLKFFQPEEDFYTPPSQAILLD